MKQKTTLKNLRSKKPLLGKNNVTSLCEMVKNPLWEKIPKTYRKFSRKIKIIQ
jgi:hypothetical protein